MNHEPKSPNKLTHEQIVSDLSEIPLNQNDVLFGEESDQLDDRLYSKLEKLVIFKSNLDLESDKMNSEFSPEALNKDLEGLDRHLNSLQHFIEISKKFLSLNK